MATLRRARPLLGTFVDIQARGELREAELMQAIDAAFEAVETIHHALSVHDPDSVASRLNRDAHRQPQHPGEPLLSVLRAALDIAARSEGAFDVVVGARLQALGLLPAFEDALAESPSWRDITIDADGGVRFARPLRLDFGGIAKGHAVDCAITALQAAGVTQALVNAGGDLRVLGLEPQTIQIRDPRQPTHLLQALQLADGALATSASYYSRREQAGQAVSALIDPRSGAAWLGGDSISVIAPRCLHADALTKVVLFAEPALAARVLERYSAQALVLPLADDPLAAYAGGPYVQPDRR